MSSKQYCKVLLFIDRKLTAYLKSPQPSGSKSASHGLYLEQVEGEEILQSLNTRNGPHFQFQGNQVLQFQFHRVNSTQEPSLILPTLSWE